ncbi:MAG: translocation/assembly module TamB domain-containing protein [Pseudomonadota bacterium]|uniref:autotransporter assembly complex protein TamB n=1 Tax=Gallaecimonas pentaromativorans TaxID=584787 RepID=UPI00067E74ED|nr:translocation/assembly module TamB domain-containing protein [Gallaecimonas pentaromativorans]MED5524422.1 translocation/assembly module TamB domain-containing protein [Pseudomonadota bacterium]
MRWLKWAAWVFLVLFTLLVLLPASVLLTDTGNRWVWSLAKDNVPGLSGEMLDGNLSRGWHFKNLQYKTEGLALAFTELKLAWAPSALLDDKLRITTLEVNGVAVDVASGSDQPASEDDSGGATKPLVLPLTVVLDQADLSDIKVSVPGMEIGATSVGLSGIWDKKGLAVNGPKVNGLSLVMAPSAEAPKADTATEAASDAPLTLPTVTLPMAITVDGMVLTDTRFQQGDVKEALPMLSFAGSVSGSDLSITSLHLEHRFAGAFLKGKLSLKGEYPLSLDLTATLKKALLDGQLSGETLALSAKGSLANLELDTRAKGPVTFNLAGKLAALEPGLPFDVTLDWQPLGWPLDAPQYHLEQGNLAAKGSLGQYQLTLETRASGPAIPQTAINLDAGGDLAHLDIRQLLLDMANGKLSLNGRLGWQEGVDWQGLVALNNLDPSFWASTLKGQVSGQLPSHFQLQGASWQLDAQPDLKGTLAGQPLALSGDVALNEALHGKVALTLENGPNSLDAKGSLADSLDIKGHLALNNLGLYGFGASGSAKGDWQLGGSLDKPRLKLRLAADSLGFNDLMAKNLNLDADATLSQDPSGTLRVSLESLRQGSELSLGDIRLALKGSGSDHHLTLAFKGQPVAGELALDGHLDGSNWQGSLASAQFDTPLQHWQLEKAVALAWQDQRFSASQHCWASQQAALCLDPISASAKGGQAGLTLTGLQLARLQPFMPDNFHWQAVLSGKASASWQGSKPKVSAHFETTPGELTSGKNQVGYQQLRIDADMDDKALTSQVAFVSDTLGTLSLDAKVTDPQQARALSGNLAIKGLTLDWLAPLLPQVYSIAGQINGEGRLGGNLSQPLFFGNLALTGGGVTTDGDMVTLSELNTRLDIDGAKAKLDGTGKLGGGQLQLSGDMSWAALPISGELHIKGNELEAGYPGYGQLKVSPDLTLTMGQETNLSGKVVVPWARIAVKELPPSAVTVSKDVVVITNNPDIAPQPVSAPFAMKVLVELGKDVRLEAMGLKTKLGGTLFITQDPNRAMRGNGEIRLVDGTYKAYGQNLVIQTGSILFSGALDSPNLNIEAIRNKDTLSDSSITVGVKVTGDAASPKVELFSDPDMQQSEQLSYLLRGKGLDSQEGSDSNGLMQSMLLSAGVSQLGGVVTGAAEKVGFSDVTIDTAGSGDSSQVAISGYLAPGLQLEYGVGVFNSVGEVKLRYELLPRLYLQAVNGVNQALDIFYKFEF